MFKDVGKKTLLISLILGLITAGGIYLYLISLNKKAIVETSSVVVALRDVPARTVLSPEYLQVKQMPKEYVHANAVDSLEEARGKIAVTPILAGEQILADRLGGGEGASGDLAYRIKPGQRAITIAANEISGVAALVQPGNYVDILVTLEKEGYGADVTKTVLQNRLVLAVDSQMSHRSTEQAKTVGHYTLEVTPHEAEILTFAQERAKITFILRSQGDEKWAETSGAGFGSM